MRTVVICVRERERGYRVKSNQVGNSEHEADSIGNINSTHEKPLKSDRDSASRGAARVHQRRFPLLQPTESKPLDSHTVRGAPTSSYRVRIQLTWFVPISKFQGVKELEEFPDWNLECLEESNFSKNPIARLLLPNKQLVFSCFFGTRFTIYTCILFFKSQSSNCIATTSQLTRLYVRTIKDQTICKPFNRSFPNTKARQDFLFSSRSLIYFLFPSHSSLLFFVLCKMSVK